MMPKCQKTLTGKHIFMPVSDRDEKIFKVHGVDHPYICIACGIYDDRTNRERAIDDKY